MINTIAGTKKQMSQAFIENRRVPVTLIKAGPCVVTQIIKEDKNGYWGVQMGFGEKKLSRLTKPIQGHVKGAIKDSKLAPSFLFEIRQEAQPEEKVGDTVNVSQVFSEGDMVSVIGTSKGKGFAGGVKRWGFAGGPKTHGQSDRHRAPGSIGQGTTPGRVRKGKKMAGRMGSEQVTLKNIKVVAVDGEKNEIVLSGPIPGAVGNRVIIRKQEKKGKVND